MALIPREPFDDLMPLRDAMNRLFQESFVGTQRALEPFVRVFPIDVRETEDAYLVEASLPGVKPEEIEITAENDTLTMRVARKHEEEKKESGTYLRRERYEGEVRRTISLPTVVDADKVMATYEHGVLTLRVPKVEPAKAKQIPIQAKEPVPVQH